MSDFERKKIISNKSRSYNRDASGGRTYSNNRTATTSTKEKDVASSELKQPTILLKSRESNAEDSSTTKKKSTKDTESATNIPRDHEAGPPTLKYMKKSLKLIEDGVMNVDYLQEYLQENTDFKVVGVVGPQGVGKSTILNMLTEREVTDQVKTALFKSHTDPTETCENGLTILTQKLENPQPNDPNIFPIQTQENLENCRNTTEGIDIYVSPHRIIFLDCQPFLSVSILDELIESENKRTNLVSEFIPLENSGEIQGLQLTAFLMSVCHILFVVQDWFFDSNVVRFIQTAEMLKPTISNPEDEYCEHYPHLILIHNRAQMADFTPTQFRIMSKVYDTLFQKTKLQLHSKLGLATGSVMPALNPENCENQVNLFVVPEHLPEGESHIYRGHPPLEDLIKKLRANVFGATKNPLTHIQLTEKTWLVYCNKVWETVKKSPFFVEYTKLMP